MTDSTPTPETCEHCGSPRCNTYGNTGRRYECGRPVYPAATGEIGPAFGYAGCDQIAALTAERDEWRERHDDLVKLADRIEAERDKEHARWLLLSARLIDAEAERDRYRDALERIAACRYLGEPTLESTIASTALIARAALTPIEEQT